MERDPPRGWQWPGAWATKRRRLRSGGVGAEGAEHGGLAGTGLAAEAGDLMLGARVVQALQGPSVQARRQLPLPRHWRRTAVAGVNPETRSKTAVRWARE